jgi:hypothetical protein
MSEQQPGWTPSPPGGGQPGATPAPPPYGYPQARPTNGLAIASLVCGLLQFAVPVVMTVLALVFGYVARNQIRERGESGEGMAKAGIILGWVGVALGVLGLLFFVAAFSALDGRGF